MIRISLALAVITASITTTVWMSRQAKTSPIGWDHWDVVQPGVLYRSGQLRPEQLEVAIQGYGLRTVVNFLIPGPEVDAERALCKKLGIGFLNLPMPGDGFGQEEQFREVLKAIDDPARRPVLVHCARGTCRTGAAVALYRYERDGWTIEDVEVEMIRQTYHQGRLASYMFAMAKDRPFAELFKPQVVRDDAPVISPPPLDEESHFHEH